MDGSGNLRLTMPMAYQGISTGKFEEKQRRSIWILGAICLEASNTAILGTLIIETGNYQGMKGYKVCLDRYQPDQNQG